MSATEVAAIAVALGLPMGAGLDEILARITAARALLGECLPLILHDGRAAGLAARIHQHLAEGEGGK